MRNTSSPKRILLIRGDGRIGDAVLGTGLLAGLRAGRPDANISLAVVEGLAPFFADCPWIDALLPMPTALDRMRQSFFDVAVDLQNYTAPTASSMRVAALAPARYRIGAPMSFPVARSAMKAAYDEVIDLAPCHDVLRYAALSTRLGGQFAEPALWNMAQHRKSALELLGRDEEWWAKPKAFVHIGASEPRRRWPQKRFAEVVDRLAAHDVEVLVVGAADEAEAVQTVASRAGVRGLPLPGTLTPLQLAAVMQGGGLFVGNDSGPMHLAAASGLPVVEVSMHARTGSPAMLNAPERMGPWGVPAVVARPDEFLAGCGPDLCTPPEGWAGPPHCITQVGVEDVWDAVLTLVSFDDAPETVGAAAS